MDPALGLGGGHALNPVHTRLPAEQAVGIGTAHGKDGLAHAAEISLAHADGLYGESVTLGEPGVHPVEIAGKETCLVSARAGTDLDNGVAVVVRVAREQQ